MSLHVIESARLEGPKSAVQELRDLADELEKSGEARSILVVIDGDGDVDFRCLGYRMRRSDSPGLLAYASQMVFVARE